MVNMLHPITPFTHCHTTVLLVLPPYFVNYSLQFFYFWHFFPGNVQVMFTLFQELAPNDPHDKAGHYYTICINLAKQRFDVLDSVRSRDDESLRSHAEFFMNNLKETWARHYSGSKVQIKDFPIEYVKSKKQGNT